MIKVHCNQLSDFLKIYLFDWHVLSALLIPLLFAVFFPVYWFLICPAVWKTDLSLYRPKSWLIGYWSLASLVWMVFLVISLFHMRNGQKLAMQVRSNCLKSYSTEDLWNEDAYIPEAYLPTPDYKVNMSQVQPLMSSTWDPESGSYLKRPTLRTPKTLLSSMKYREEATECEQRQPLLLPPPSAFQNEITPDDENKLENDTANFDTILASLQSLAHELERDFEPTPLKPNYAKSTNNTRSKK